MCHGSASGCCDAFPLPPSALRLISRLPPSEFRICFPPSALFFAFPFLGSACFFLVGDYLGVRPGPSLSTGAIANGHLIALTSASETARNWHESITPERKMSLDVKKSLKKFLPYLIKAQEDDLKEADTTLPILKVFEETLGYDPPAT